MKQFSFFINIYVKSFTAKTKKKEFVLSLPFENKISFFFLCSFQVRINENSGIGGGSDDETDEYESRKVFHSHLVSVFFDFRIFE